MAAAKAVDADSEDYNSTDYASIPKGGFKLDRANTEPMPVRNRESSKPARGRRSPDESNPSSSVDDLMPNTTSLYGDKHKSVPNTRTRRGSSPPGMVRPRTIDAAPPVPKIIETPPPPAVEIPERVSSFESPAIIRPESVNRNPTSNASPAKPEHMTVPELKKKRPEVSSGTASSTAKERKTSWGNWFSGDSKEKEKEREREERAKIKKEKDKRPKSTEKLDKHDKTDKTDKTDKHDNTRLDLLQKSIELGHGSKVATVDPIPVVAVEPPKAEVREARKSRVEEKKEKEKDSGFLSFFGGSRKKSSDHTASAAAAEKKGRNSRGTSPDPAAQEKVQPFYYTRFPIHIERAIYRLSHLKLANPRRPLQQQVLLSNFMYSYLAKVQQTQPHLIQQATVSPSQLQKQQAAEMQRQQEQQRWQQRQEEQQQYSDLSNQYYDDVRFSQRVVVKAETDMKIGIERAVG